MGVLRPDVYYPEATLNVAWKPREHGSRTANHGCPLPVLLHIGRDVRRNSRFAARDGVARARAAKRDLGGIDDSVSLSPADSLHKAFIVGYRRSGCKGRSASDVL